MFPQKMCCLAALSFTFYSIIKNNDRDEPYSYNNSQSYPSNSGQSCYMHREYQSENRGDSDELQFTSAIVNHKLRCTQ
jgi:hypothetical protein